MQRQRFWMISRGLGLWMLALLVPLASEALIVSSTGRINFRDEGVAEGSSGTVNCQGDGIACEIVNGTLNINVGGGAETSLEDPGGNGLINRTGAGVTAPYAGTTCTNQVLRVLSAAGAGTCVTLTSAYVDASIALTAGHLGQFASTTSAQLATVLSDESGASGVFVRTGAKLDVFAATSSAELATVLSDEDGVTGGFVRTGGNVATATALAANPTDCAANTYATTIAANGNLTCAAVNLAAGVTGTLPFTAVSGTLAQLNTAISDADLVADPGSTGLVQRLTATTSGAITSSTVGHVLRVTGGNTFGFGALDLSNSAAVTGLLPNAATTGTSAAVADTLVLRDSGGHFSAATVTATLLGNATTATALATNPSDCGAGEFATAIAASGNLTCATPAGGGNAQTAATLAQFAATTSAQLAGVLTDEEGTTGGFVRAGGTVALATALAANPADCAANTYATTIAASGDLTCSQVSLTAGVSGVLPAGNLPATLAFVSVANLWADGIKQTFNPNGTTAGLNVGSHTSAPLTLADGDLWYDSSGGALMARINGTSVALGAGGGGSLTVMEIDGSPSGTFATLKFSNGSLTDNGDGSATIVTGGSGGGDFSSNTATSVDSEVVLFSGAGGKTGKRATGTGLAKLTSGVLGVAVAETDYVTPAGTVATATALVANGANCAAGQAPLGVDALGAVEGCFSTTPDLTASGSLFDGTAGSLACGSATGGQMQIGPSSTLEYCGYEETPLLHLAGLPAGLAWGDTAACASDENLGKLTVVAGIIQCSPDVSDAATTAWNDGAATSLTCGGGAQGQHQIMDDGRLQYCDGATDSVLRAGFLLPTPLSFNINTATCTGDTNGGKLTVNANQIVCASDVVGEGGEGTGDITAVGNLSTGDAGTTGAPLTNLWWLEAAQPSPPASTQGLTWLDNTSKNFSIITSDGVVKRMVQSVDAVANQVLTALAPDGAFSQAQLTSANLSDGSTLARLSGPQILTATQVVPRVVTLSASSGTVTAPNADLSEVFERHDIAGTLTIPNPTTSGLNPRPHQPITFSLYAASAQAVVWDTGYATGYGIALPTTLPAGQYVAVGMRWNVLSGKWETWGNTADTLTTVADGGTGVATLTGVAIGNGTSPFTAATSSTVGQILRVTGANTFAWGAVDLADTDAVTGVLPFANTGGTLAALNTAISDANVVTDARTVTIVGTTNEITSSAGAQDLSANRTWTLSLPSALDFGTKSVIIPNSTTLPGTCTVGQLYMDTDATSGQRFYLCQATNTWVLQGSGGSGSTGTIHLSPGGYILPASDAAVLDASMASGWLELKFDNTTRECAVWQGRMNADYVSGLTLKAPYKTLATAGSVHLDVRLKVLTIGVSGSVVAETPDSWNDCNDTAVPGTASVPDEISCALTANDSIAAGRTFQLELCRDVANDDAAAKASLLAPSLEYTR